jgi:hypothetical protein
LRILLLFTFNFLCYNLVLSGIANDSNKYVRTFIYQDSLGNEYNTLTKNKKMALLFNGDQITGFEYDSIKLYNKDSLYFYVYLEGIPELLNLNTRIAPDDDLWKFKRKVNKFYFKISDSEVDALNQFFIQRFDSIKIENRNKYNDAYFYKGTSYINIPHDFIQFEKGKDVKFYLSHKIDSCRCTHVSPFFSINIQNDVKDSVCLKLKKLKWYEPVLISKKEEPKLVKGESKTTRNRGISKEGLAAIFSALGGVIFFLGTVWIKSL